MRVQIVHEPGRIFQWRVCLIKAPGDLSPAPKAMRAWCLEEFGPMQTDGRYVWTDGINTFFFVREHDAVHFRIRWT